jgi:hypothetical protein
MLKLNQQSLMRALTCSLVIVWLAACGAETTNSPIDAPQVTEPSPPQPAPLLPTDPVPSAPHKIIEPHQSGVFFDRRPLVSGAVELAGNSRPSVASMQSATIIDASGFGQPMPAMQIDIPQGWSMQGGVEWNRNVECIGNTHAFNWTASSADGMHGISLFPGLTWQVESAPAGLVALNPCPAAPMRSAQEYLQFLAQQSRPAARVLDFRARPELAEAMRTSQPTQNPGPAQVRFDSGELLIGYDLQGIPMRESLVATITISELQGTIVAWSDIPMSLRAPDGLLDFAVLEHVRRSSRLDTRWSEQLISWSRQAVEMLNQRQVRSIQDWHNRRMSEINLAGMTARHQLRMDTISEIGRINNQIVASNDASASRQHEAFKDYIQEVQPWRDPNSGQQLDLSIHYANAWQLGDGRQFLTNDTNFDPNRDLGITGYRLEPAR